MLKFGTDGVRGNAETDLPPEQIVALGRALGQVFGGPQLLIGRDTRASGAAIASQLALGLKRQNVEAVQLGVLPTPAIAFSAARESLPAAIVSASHNPWTDNGVKVVGADGRKLSDETEAAIEDALERATLGRVRTYADGRFDGSADERRSTAYADHLLSVVGPGSLEGLYVVLDAANGAGFAIGPRVLREAGARVSVINDDPDGRNINDGCGSTHPQSLQREVVSLGADLGLALDGDADRVLAVDETGALVDGDQIMTMAALDMKARGVLNGNTLVVTVMSNLGLQHAMRDAGIEVLTTPVGDRHVVAAMRAGEFVLGGEQSGHIVFSQYATTGDGLLTGLVVCELVRRSRQPLSLLSAPMTRYPQVLVNVRVAGPVDVAQSSVLADAIAGVEAEFGDEGRVLVRASGTEPLVRVMVEAATSEDAERATAQLTAVVESEFGTV